MEKKILWILPKSPANVLLGGLIVAFVLAWIWSIVMAQSFSTDYAWVQIIEYLLYAVLVGWAIGMFAGNASKSTLWIAAGLTWVGVVITHGLMGYAPAGFDAAILSSFGSTAFETSFSVGAVVFGIIAAATAAVGGKSK